MSKKMKHQTGTEQFDLYSAPVTLPAIYKNFLHTDKKLSHSNPACDGTWPYIFHVF